MRVSLVLLVLASLAAVSNAALFSQQTPPPWSPRILQGWAFPTGSFTYTTSTGTSTTVPASTSNVLAWGGNTYNDTYLSTTSGASWTLIGGIGASTNSAGAVTYTVSPHPTTFNCDDSDCCKTYDPLKNVYYVVDQFYAYTSTNGLDWTTVGSTEFAGRQSAYCTVDPSSNLYIIGGQNTTGSLYENDIWQSSNQAASFTQRSTAPWSERDSQNGWVHKAPLGATVLYAIGGHAEIENTRPNEVWVSSDSGSTWRLLSYGPFLGRDHFGAGITSSGIMLVVGGKLMAENALKSHLGANDVWASLDGGATFGFCGNAEWPVRQDHRFAIDNQDYLYVSGGTSNNQTGPTVSLGDVWRSTASWTSASVVAAQCGLTVPACGVGLRCWPNATNIVFNSTGGATYPAPVIAPYNCPCVPASNNTNTGNNTNPNGAASIASHSNIAAVVLMVLLSFVAHLAV